MAKVGTGRTISGKANIPVKEMALGMLDKMFPHLSPEQIDALKNGTPVPPSKDWQNPAGTESPLLAQAAAASKPPATTPLEVTGLPLVTAILVYDRPDARQAKMARKAVNQFVQQTYPNKQLIIVNGTDTTITNVPWREIKEVQVGRDTIAGYRNRGLDLADGDWVKPCWDDDDVYDPHLLSYLMLHRQPGKAVLLTTQIRAAIWKDIVYTHFAEDGIANTMLVPKSEARFQAVDQEDVFFATHHYGVKRVVVDNRKFPLSTLSVAIYHDHNKTPLDQFMVGHASPELRGRWEVGEAEAEYLKRTLATFGLSTTVNQPSEKRETVSAS